MSRVPFTEPTGAMLRLLLVRALALTAVLCLGIAACTGGEATPAVEDAKAADEPTLAYTVTFDPKSYADEHDAAVLRCFGMPGGRYTGTRTSRPPRISGTVQGDAENAAFMDCVRAIPGTRTR